jgi:hypothetical protein
MHLVVLHHRAWGVIGCCNFTWHFILRCHQRGLPVRAFRCVGAKAELYQLAKPRRPEKTVHLKPCHFHKTTTLAQFQNCGRMLRWCCTLLLSWAHLLLVGQRLAQLCIVSLGAELQLWYQLVSWQQLVAPKDRYQRACVSMLDRRSVAVTHSTTCMQHAMQGTCPHTNRFALFGSHGRAEMRARWQRPCMT